MNFFLRALPRAARRDRAAGFSLVEITLALGLVAFALVGIVGVLPVAMTSSRQSFDKSRAVTIADTLFASFRSQPFQNVGYLDAQFDSNGNLQTSPTPAALDLNAQSSSSTPVKFYAKFLNVASDTNTADAFGAQRRLTFAAGPPAGADYLVTLTFNNQPTGMASITPQASSSPNGVPVVPAVANQIELIVSPTNQPTDQYRFVSIVSNRTN